jgi:peroxiredoxin Q/BCP
MLKLGDKAPDFEGVTDSGERIRLTDLLKEHEVVLYFYPKDDTPGCTAEACAFRDNWDKVREKGALVIGISSDDVESHRKFKGKYKLPFTLVSDHDGKIRELYGAKGFLLPDRVTFVIDRKGIIRHVYKSQMRPENHVKEALRALEEIAKEGYGEGGSKGK